MRAGNDERVGCADAGRPGGRPSGLVGLTLVLACVLAPGARAQEPTRAATPEVVVDLAERYQLEDERGRARLEQDLAQLGAVSSATVFDMLAGDVPKGHEPLSGAGRELLLTTLGAWDREVVVPAIATRIDAKSRLDQQLLALRLIGDLGDERALDSFFATLENVSGEYLQNKLVGEQVEAALGSLLERSTDVFSTLEQHLGGAPERQVIVVRALGADGRGLALPLLARVMGSSDLVDCAVIDALAALAAWDEPCLEGRQVELVRPFLHAWEPEARRRAALAVARMRDTASLPRLVELLEDGDRQVAGAARWALRDFSGLDLGRDIEAWNEWYRVQVAWLENEAPVLLAEAHCGHVGRAGEALRKLSEHPALWAELAVEILPLLDHRDERLIVAACLSLVRMRALTAVPALLELLGDGRPAVRAAAHAGLQALTGGRLPTAPA